MLLDMASVNPLAVYQIAIAAIHPSLTSLALIPLAALVGHLAINARVLIRLGMGARRVVDGCLVKGISGTTVLVSEVLRLRYSDGVDTYHDLEKWLVQFNGMLARKLDDMVAVHYAPGSGVFTTYTHSQFYSSHVFVSSLPVGSSPVQRFFFLHEIFHSLMYIATRPVASIAALPAHLCLAAWLACTLPWHTEIVGPILGLVITVLVWHERTRWNLQRLKVSSESVADAAAVVYLADADLKQLRDSRVLALLTDKELTPLENATRRSALREYIGLALQGNRDEVIKRSSEDLAITAPRFVELLFLCSVVVLATYAEPPTTVQLWLAGGWFLAVTLMFAFAAVLYLASHGALAEAIERQFPKAAAGEPIRPSPMSTLRSHADPQ